MFGLSRSKAWRTFAQLIFCNLVILELQRSKILLLSYACTKNVCFYLGKSCLVHLELKMQ